MEDEVCPVCGAEEGDAHDETCPFRDLAIDLKIEKEKKDNEEHNKRINDNN